MTSERKVRWALVGLGDIVRKRVGAALLAQPQSTLHACVTRDPGTRESELALLKPQQVYTNMEQALADPAIDAFYLATPVHLHAPHTIAALRAGKHVLVEKPMALDSSQCAAMIEAAQKADRRLSVAYYRRFWPTFQRVKEMIQRGELGQLVLIRVALHSWHAPAPGDPKGWRLLPEQGGGGVLMDVGCHRLDLLAWWFGLPRRVAAEVKTRTHDYAVEDSAVALLGFADDVPCTASFHWNSKTWADEIHVVGTEARIAIGAVDGDVLMVQRGRETTQEKLELPSNYHYPLIDDFASAITGGVSPRFDGEDGLAATRIIDAIFQAARSKSWVELG
jgi:predicted dehydrogenase